MAALVLPLMVWGAPLGAWAQDEPFYIGIGPDAHRTPFYAGYPNPDPQGENLHAMSLRSRSNFINVIEAFLGVWGNTYTGRGHPTVDVLRATIMADSGDALIFCGVARFWFAGETEPVSDTAFVIHTQNGVLIFPRPETARRWCGSFHARLR
jgi:hypothetical protein